MGRGVILASVDSIFDSSVAMLANRVVSFFAPKPAPFGLVRLGGKRDGAYLLPKNLEGIDACFSPGVANRKDFEDDLLDQYGVRSHLLDGSSDIENFKTPLVEGMQSFQKEWLTPESGEGSISLDDWVRIREPGEGTNLLLQMDIEGAEYDVLLSASESVLGRFRYAVIEFHNLSRMILGGPAEREILSRTIERLGETFVAVHSRANNCCAMTKLPGTNFKIPEVLEVTFAHQSQLNSSGRFRRPLVPHPLDIRRNVESRKPLHLSGKWREESSFFLPSLKVFADWTFYFLQSPDRLPRWMADRIYLKFSAKKREAVSSLLRGRMKK